VMPSVIVFERRDISWIKVFRDILQSLEVNYGYKHR